MSKHKPDNLDEAVDEVEKLIDIAYQELKQRRQTTNREVEPEEKSQKPKNSKGKKKRRNLSPLAKSIVVGEILNRKF